MLVLLVALIGSWSWFWHYATGRAETAIAGWRAREAIAGRVYTCGSQTIGGYPFRIEVTCSKAAALFRSNQPPVEVKTGEMLIAAQIYDPTLLITEFNGPLSVAEPGKPPFLEATWTLGQSSVRGTPAAPQRVSLVFDDPKVDRLGNGNRINVLHAKRIEVHGRIVEGTVTNHPVIEIVTRLRQAAAPTLHPAAARPLDADITAVLRGLNDFSPKPWPARFREIQAAGGRIDIADARVQQGETIAVGSGSLGLNANGRLDGQLRVTVAGLEPFLDFDQCAADSAEFAGHGQGRRRPRPYSARPRRHGASAGEQFQFLARHHAARPADRAGRQASGDAAVAHRRRHGVSRTDTDRRHAGAVLTVRASKAERFAVVYWSATEQTNLPGGRPWPILRVRTAITALSNFTRPTSAARSAAS